MDKSYVTLLAIKVYSFRYRVDTKLLTRPPNLNSPTKSQVPFKKQKVACPNKGIISRLYHMFRLHKTRRSLNFRKKTFRLVRKMSYLLVNMEPLAIVRIQSISNNLVIITNKSLQNHFSFKLTNLCDFRRWENKQHRLLG